MEDLRRFGAAWYYREFWSFAQVPTGSDQALYGRALLCCCNGDGTLHPDERNWVLGAATVRGFPLAVIEDLKTYMGTDDVAEIVRSSPTVARASRALIYDALCACDADGVLAEGEWASIVKMAAALDVPESIVKQIHDARAAEKSATQARIKVVYPDGRPY